MIGFANELDCRQFFIYLGFLIRLDHGLKHAGDVFGADFVGFAAGVALNHLAKSHRALHRSVVAVQILAQALFRQRFPTADDFRGIVHLQLVVGVRQQLLNAPVDVRFFYRQHNHFVVHQQTARHCFGKVDGVKQLAVERRVIHRTQRDAVFFRRGLRHFAVNTRRGGHVKALFAANKGTVVYANKGAFVITGVGLPGGAVRFVADNQIKIRHAKLRLRGIDHGYGMVGAKHHRHAAAVKALVHGVGQGRCIGAGRVTQFVREGLHHVIVFLALFTDIGIGTHGKTIQRQTGFLRPFAQRLRQQRQARHQKQHALARAAHRFGNFQAGERFAGAARHN